MIKVENTIEEKRNECRKDRAKRGELHLPHCLPDQQIPFLISVHVGPANNNGPEIEGSSNGK